MKYDLSANFNLINRFLALFKPQTPSPPTIPIDYRDRISVVTWLIVFGMGLSLLYAQRSNYLSRLRLTSQHPVD